MLVKASTPIVLIALLFASSCTLKQLGSAMRSFSTKELQPVIVGEQRFPVEERTQIHDADKPAEGENVTIAVYTTVNGQLVYCGTSRNECSGAITKFLYGYNPDEPGIALEKKPGH